METVLITGASRGIGLGLARQFLERGFRVIGTYRGSPSAELVTLSASANLSLVEVELTDEVAIAKLSASLANQPIDILINNAGVLGPENQSLAALDVEGWLHTFAVNSIAPLLVSRALLPNLALSAHPRIATLSSQMGSLASQGTGMFAYRSSKAAVNKVMQVLSVELQEQGISVCLFHPGWVKTDMGGPNAEITVRTSAAGIADQVCRLSMEDTGKFFTWDGEQLAW